MTLQPKHILVPISLNPEDDQTLARHAVEAACDLAEKFGSKITLVHMASISIPSHIGVDATGQIYETLSMVLNERTTRARLLMADFQKQVEARKINVTSSVVDITESTAHAICETAQDLKADLVVVSSHSRRGIKKLLLGSVAEKVVHLSTIPVLLLPTQHSG